MGPLIPAATGFLDFFSAHGDSAGDELEVVEIPLIYQARWSTRCWSRLWPTVVDSDEAGPWLILAGHSQNLRLPEHVFSAFPTKV